MTDRRNGLRPRAVKRIGLSFSYSLQFFNGLRSDRSSECILDKVDSF